METAEKEPKYLVRTKNRIYNDDSSGLQKQIFNGDTTIYRLSKIMTEIRKCPSLKMRGHVPHPHKITGKITVVYILSFCVL
jgi:hypothetical protein